jgi:hypothetical protein
VAVLVGGTLLLFGLAEWAGFPLLTDPLPAMRGAGVAAPLSGSGLLMADVFVRCQEEHVRQRADTHDRGHPPDARVGTAPAPGRVSAAHRRRSF